MIKLALAALLSTSILVGCGTLESQTIPLSLTAPSGLQMPAEVPVEVQGIDSRPTLIVGDRIDKFSNRAPITVPNASDALKKATQKALINRGFDNFGKGGFTVTANLRGLTYTAELNNVTQQVEVKAEMELVIRRGVDSYTGSYQTRLEEMLIQTPDAEANTQMLNNIVEQTLIRAFADKKVHEFILTHR